MEINVKIKPLSVNEAFKGRHFKTAGCKTYEKELWILLPKKEMIKGEIELWFDFFLIHYGRNDISNLVKVTEDILVKKGYIEDDRKIVRMHLSKTRSKENSITIKIKELI